MAKFITQPITIDRLFHLVDIKAMESEFRFFNAQEPNSLGADGVYIVHIPPRIRSKEELMSAYLKNAELPEYFGMNWDSLEELLCDFSWIEQKNIAIVHEDFPALQIEDVRVIYIDILRSALNYWKTDSNHKLTVFFPESDMVKVVDAERKS